MDAITSPLETTKFIKRVNNKALIALKKQNC